MEQNQHSEIMQAIGQLQGTVEGILTEARRTNGRLLKVEDRMDTVDEFKNQQIGKQTILGVAFGAFFSIVGIIAAKKLGF